MTGLVRNHPVTPRQHSLFPEAKRKGKSHAALTQADLLLSMLRAARSQGSALELPAIMRAGIAQHGARLFELRERGFIIVNQMERHDGAIRSRYRLTFDPESEGQ